jgi:cell surface protein SprA
LKIDLPDNYFAGVSYKRPFIGEQIGIISTDTNVRSTDTLVLKMVKVANLIPQNTLAWELQLRNIYKLPITNVNSDGFEFDVKYLSNGIYKSNLPGISTSLLTITGLDKYSNGRSGGPGQQI